MEEIDWESTPRWKIDIKMEIKEIWCGCVDWIHLVLESEQLTGLFTHVTELPNSTNSEYFFANFWNLKKLRGFNAGSDCCHTDQMFLSSGLLRTPILKIYSIIMFHVDLCGCEN
jgi:hypothetical protein